jgi:hypothetical protein
MKPVARQLISVGVGALIDFFRTEKPLRTWIRKRRAAKGKGPILDTQTADDLALKGLDEAAKRLKKF